MGIAVVRGVGDVGSIVAVALLRGGFRVVLHDRPSPSHCRRAISFTDALFEGAAAFDGVVARYVADVSAIEGLGGDHAIPVLDASLSEVIAAVKPEILVDARMRKHAAPEMQRHLAPFTIGLGPNFVAGQHVDVVIETAHEAQIGCVIRTGRAKDLAGEPRLLAGHGRERFVYAPVAGTFHTTSAIGDSVKAGQELGSIGSNRIVAPIAGWVRGLSHDGSEVEEGAKIVEVDASVTPVSVGIIGERAQRIAAGVLGAARECRTFAA